MENPAITTTVRTPRASGQEWKDSGALPDGSAGSETNDDFQPLTQQEASELRGRMRPVSPARLLLIQGLVGVLTAVCAGLLGQGWSTGLSALYGAAVVVVPGAVMAWALRARPFTVSAAQRAVSFLFWELVKIVLAVAMLLLATRVVAGLSWLALLAGMVLSMKVYGLALLWRGR